MSERTQRLREVVYSHDPMDPYEIFKVLLDEIDTQAARIKGVEEEVQRAKARHDEHVAKLHKGIEKLKGVHGA